MKTKYRDGANIVTVEVTVESRILQFDDILQCCRAEGDSGMTAPWKEEDGWDHTKTPVPSHVSAKGFNVANDGRFRQCYLNFTPQAGIPDYDHFRARGAAKQVARELAAQMYRRNMETLVRWYNEGWSYTVVICEYRGATAAIGGYLDFDRYDQKEQQSIYEEVAFQVVEELEKQGYEVQGQPSHDMTAANKLCRANRIKNNVHIFDHE